MTNFSRKDIRDGHAVPESVPVLPAVWVVLNTTDPQRTFPSAVHLGKYDAFKARSMLEKAFPENTYEVAKYAPIPL